MARRIRSMWRAIQEPFPEGWVPVRGEDVIVPQLSGHRTGAQAAKVTKVLDDIVEVRMTAFNGARRQYLLRDIRPRNRRT